MILMVGYKLRNTSGNLRAFASFAAGRRDTHVRISTAIDWATEGTSPYTRHIRLRDAARWPTSCMPRTRHTRYHPIRFARPSGGLLPYIYTTEEIVQLVRATTGLASARVRGRKGGAPFRMNVAKMRSANSNYPVHNSPLARVQRLRGKFLLPRLDNVKISPIDADPENFRADIRPVRARLRPARCSGRPHATIYTQWTTVADLRARKYYIKSYQDQVLRSVDLTSLDLDAKTLRIAPFKENSTPPPLSFNQ
jgi:hypothetical protein